MPSISFSVVVARLAAEHAVPLRQLLAAPRLTNFRATAGSIPRRISAYRRLEQLQQAVTCRDDGGRPAIDARTHHALIEGAHAKKARVQRLVDQVAVRADRAAVRTDRLSRLVCARG
jgi:hypothetical protein